MGITRKLENILCELEPLANQGEVAGFFSNIQNLDRLSGMVEDIRDAMMDYQVCISNSSHLLCLMFMLDFITTRHL